jgi:hypothetical protein
MGANVLIAGAGQLGSRHLQGLSKCAQPIAIWVHDVSIDSLERAKQRWLECDPRPHSVVYTNDLDTIPSQFDLAIVATNADVRLGVIEDIARTASVRYWLLEKVLTQSVADLRALARPTSASLGVWVNTPMHLWPLYRKVRERCNDQPVHAYFGPFRGLACNAIHYIDLVSGWGRGSVSRIDTSQLRGGWVASKRAGFFEVEGRLSVQFSDASTLVLEGDEQSAAYDVRIRVGDDTWYIDETKGLATCSSGATINAPILRQSELTAPLTDEILTRGYCDLPTLAVSTAQHEPLL